MARPGKQKAVASRSAGPQNHSKSSLAGPKPPESTANAAKPLKGKGQISDELRQAVKDLGGNDEDLELIAGIDDDEDGHEEPKTPVAGSSKSSEKDLKKALGDFMKGLDFKAAGAAMPEVEDDYGSGEDSEEGSEEDDDHEVDDSQAGEENVMLDQTKAQTNGKATRTDAVSAAIDTQATSGSIVPGNPSWTSLIPQLPPLPTLSPLSPPQLQSLRSRADALLANLPPLNRKSTSADAAFISQVLQSGTHQDKLAALVLLVRESPIHAVKELSRLRSMAGYKEGEGAGASGGGNKDQRLAVCKALVDWWVSGGGKESGKLRYFADQPLLAHPKITERHLLVFAFEDFLKKWFFHLLQVLEVFSHDPLPFIRTQALQMTFRLLQGNAEQEQNLLRLSANKLGDTDKSVASKTSHLLLTLLQVHPAMKAVVAREVTSMILKPAPPASSTHVRFDQKPDPKGKAKADGGEGHHARYYGLITLNQITLTAKQDQELAGRLVDVYFEVFREILGASEAEEREAKREGKDNGLEEKVGKVEKWQGRRKKGNADGKKGKKEEKDEEGLEGDARLVAAVLTGINRAMPYAKLDEAAFKSYMDTLFRITHKGTFNTSIQSLSLIFQIASASSSSTAADGADDTRTLDRFYRTLYDSLFDPRLLTSSKQAMHLNLLFKAMKADKEIKRVMAFVKRLCQMFGMADVPFLSGALFLLGELFSVLPGLKRMLIEPEDDGEERFVDAPEDGETLKTTSNPNGEHQSNRSEGYDGMKREPLYAKADTSCLWEIHYHPSISLLSTQLLLSQPLTGSSDISQNTLIAFLDKFVYRNPKKNLAQRGASVMQPAASGDKGVAIRQQRGAKGKGEAGAVNTEAFWKKRVEEVPVDQLFFHKFFSAKLAKKDAGSKKKARAGSDDVDDASGSENEDEQAGSDVASSSAGSEVGEGDEAGSDSELDEDEVWKAMQASMPDAGDDGLDISEDEDLEYSSDGDEENGGLDEVDIDDAEVSLDEDDNEGSEAGSAVEEEEEDDEEDGFPDMADEDDDLISLNELENMPNIVLNAESSPEPEDAIPGGDKGAKRKRAAEERKERKKKRKELPLFGSYEDWQKLIDEAGNEDED